MIESPAIQIPRPPRDERPHEDRRRAQSEALWAMSADERVAAMWESRLTLHQLAEWSRRRPNEIPLLGGEFAWIVMRTPEWIESSESERIALKAAA